MSFRGGCSKEHENTCKWKRKVIFQTSLFGYVNLWWSNTPGSFWCFGRCFFFFFNIVSVIIVAEGSGRIAKGLNHDMAFIYSGEHPLSRLRLIPVDTVGYIYIAFCSFYS